MVLPTRSNKIRFVDGEKVLCYEPDQSMARVLYESKILECIQDKDEKGRKITEYRIHFNGWNSSWDRCVPEEFILPATEENRALQKTLFEEATTNLKGNMRKRVNKEKLNSRKHRKRKDTENEQASKNSRISVNAKDSESDESSSDSQSSRLSSDDSSSSDEEESNESDVELEIPLPLKSILTFDCDQIKAKNKILKLPCRPNVITVLESFVKNIAVNVLCVSEEPKNSQHSGDSDNKIKLCKEVVDGLRIYFDFMLPELLIYNEEKAQYSSVMNSVKKKLASSPNKNIRKEKDVNVRCKYKDVHHSKNKEKSSHLKNGAQKQLATKLDVRTPKETSCRKENSMKLSEKSSKESIKRKLEKQSKDFQSIHKYPLRHAHFNTDLEWKKKRDSTPVSSTNDTKPRGRGRGRGRGISRQETKSPESPLIGSTNHTAAKRLRNGRKISPKPSRISLKSPENTNSCEVSQNVAESNDEKEMITFCEQTSISNRDLSAAQKKEGGDANIAVQDRLNDIMAWKLLPDDVHQTYPVMPSYVYGAVHLLRMFVKIPDLLKNTDIKNEKLKIILQYIQEFLQYLTERKEDLFPKLAYIDASNS
ncbi:Male-specific lethal 3 [Nymphon striatum]|nr:Male-specific lethal 3 [Nymphon striatum]